jgi:hypothetical protein
VELYAIRARVVQDLGGVREAAYDVVNLVHRERTRLAKMHAAEVRRMYIRRRHGRLCDRIRRLLHLTVSGAGYERYQIDSRGRHA